MSLPSVPKRLGSSIARDNISLQASAESALGRRHVMTWDGCLRVMDCCLPCFFVYKRPQDVTSSINMSQQ
ncbi:hypothetical protein IFM46972_01341 [Aspergillus udagawae]|uniref:Uncharacterized protein n=1 Tax=Aspergillus udagawae TaxID=91492 RepID=A0A8H3NA37_9EURO|nr:hypothetical protein IFM46972_01341 [Aspergillus udagawae]